MSPDSRILIVDDQPEILELTALVLRGAGYRVDCVSSGIEALDHLAAHPCSLVLLDIDMPGMSGWETLRLIRADEPLAGLPVVMFSVKSEFRDRVLGMQEGAIDYITKPFEVDQLLYRVRRILERPTGGDPRPASSHPAI
jgi:DNA-binding response OmpR family regulator